MGLVVPHALTRTVTEADNVLFTTMTLNPARLHLDAEYAATTEFGRPLVNSMFTVALLVGISVLETTHGTTIANLGFEEVAFPAPVFYGDTIHAESEVVAARASKSRPDQGIVTFEHRAFNQHDVLVCRARCALMVPTRRRPDRRMTDGPARAPCAACCKRPRQPARRARQAPPQQSRRRRGRSRGRGPRQRQGGRPPQHAGGRRRARRRPSRPRGVRGSMRCPPSGSPATWPRHSPPNWRGRRPKLESPWQLDIVTDALDAAGLGHLHVLAGIETAQGVESAVEVFRPPVAAAYFGAEDFIADMGGVRTDRERGVLYARSHRVALLARLAGVLAIDQVVTVLDDEERFLADAADGRAIGYRGKLCIHPAQVPLANRAFSSSPEEIERAHRLLAAYDAAVAEGEAAIAFEGQMVDEPLARHARAVLAAASDT